MRYIVIEENTVDDLERGVNTYLQKGYKLQGGASVAVYCDSFGSRWRYIQAMVKENS